MSILKHLDLFLILTSFLTCALVVSTHSSIRDEALTKNKTILIRKHLKRLKKIDGGVRLVGGRGEYEGESFLKKKTFYLEKIFRECGDPPPR